MSHNNNYRDNTRHNQQSGTYGGYQHDPYYEQYESQHTDPFQTTQYYNEERSSSTDRLQAVPPSHVRPDSTSPHRRSTQLPGHEYNQYMNNDTEYTGAYHSDDRYQHYDNLRNSNYYHPQVTGQPQTTAYSPLDRNPPPIPNIVEDLVPDPNQQRYSDPFYNNETVSAASFNAFPTNPNETPLHPSADTYYHGASGSMSELPLNNNPYVENIELQDSYGKDEEMEIGMGPVHGDNYELNTFQKELYDDEYSYGDESEADEYEIPPESQRRKIEVGLLNGNLVLDCPVPDRILERYENKIMDESREFKFMRYQAATCDPKDFVGDQFNLRQRYYKKVREVEIMVVITIYNEDDVLLARTLKGVFDNIKHLEGRNRSSTWGQDSWKKVVVCIVADGRLKLNERAQALLAGLGVYQEGFARNAVNDKKVVSHIYEYSSMIGIGSIESDTVKLCTASVPVQLVFCLKEENKKKINSHRWALQAFGEVLDPKVVILLDAGTQPSKDSIYHLWKEFDKDPNVAGTCGEIKAMLGKNYRKLINPLVAAQNFEYKMSNILDKPTESVFGFISVLPGAFSAYRYTALKNQPNGDGPLAKYFAGETLHDRQAGVFKANMYLAEDRILCFELVAKQNCSWVLKYCRSASAETDVPEEVHDFVSQRRRWLNGSFFAAIYSLVHFHKLFFSSHGFGRKFVLMIEFFYQFLSLLISWFSLASFFLVFRILTTSLGDLYKPCKYLSVVFLWLYLLSVVTTFVLSFGNTPKGTPKFYLVIIIFFAVLMAYMIAAAIVMSVNAIQEVVKEGPITAKVVFQNQTFRDLIISTLSTYALYFLASFLHLKPMHMFTSFVQYLLLSPSYVNVLNIYAFCNLHDISWGTKGATAAALGDAKITEDGKVQYIDAPITTFEINNLYEKQMDILAHVAKPKPPVTEESIKREEQQRKDKEEEHQKDYYAFIRSMVVLIWITTNFIIIAVVLETGGVNQLQGTEETNATDQKSDRSRIFLSVILWIVAFMAAFRLFGTTYYLISRMVR
ncbi:chitin synthase [Wickerhamomyces ciferrii]|uniref:chitin synthase n=1 Tax=Wickerhamomyces ciferrii (strain ATCC 14091 / BCRC 22168 / CBS 111 / JCM 3599 / NBRC 0793 / NRRL Y-1031 F-60-10) TaxID=1206466 RepID=K0KKF4_WICCF|nr:chitin synthase [Wickerhamomyces ciferrii]CCH45695.1 chitin synthase [Wickerhamomyces ciferrii]